MIRNLSIKVYLNFDYIKADYLEFEKRFALTPFQSADWLELWNDKVGLPLLKITPQIVKIKVDEKIFMILPFGIRKKYGVKILEWMGGINSDYLGPIFDKDLIKIKNINLLWSRILVELKKFDAINLEKQSIEVVKILKTIGLDYEFKEHEKSERVILPNSWDEYQKSLKKNLKSDTKRQKRRLNEIGDLKFYQPIDAKSKKAIIKEMIAQKRIRYKLKKQWDMFDIKEYRDFYMSLSCIKSSSFSVQCSSIKINNELIATHIGILNKDSFYYLMPSHLSNFHKYSPGRILLFELIERAIDRNVDFFDFTIGGEIYKKSFINDEQLLFKSIKAFNIFGVYFSNIENLKSRLKSFLLND